MRNNRHKYYVPGMISLIALPLFFFYYLNYYATKNIERSLHVAIPQNYNPNDKNTMRYDTTFLSKPKSKRNYQTIRLNENEKEDKLKLDSFRLSVRSLVQTLDTINGIHLLFHDSTKYGSFIEAINICKKERAMTFCFYKDNFWVFIRPSNKEQYKESIKYEKESIKREKDRIEMDNYYKLTPSLDIKNMYKVWPIFLAFLFLAFLSLQKVLLSKKNRTDKTENNY